MDFMKLLKSLEDLLYEMVSWLVFYPITMWRSLTNPLRMMQYADEELADRPEEQYTDTLSPPLFLLLTLLVAQAISAAIPSIYADAALPTLLAPTANLLLARGVIFGVLPLVMAVTLVRRKSTRLTRQTLRPPFYSQCYVASSFVFVAGIGLDLMLIPHHLGLTAGIALFAVATLWYGVAQVRWFKHDLAISTFRAVALFAGRFVIAIIVILAVALMIGWTLKNWK
ncbi:permease [Rhizobium sp. RM]|uniref:permease n=1 Tax=Rhizobium sp. RM TaxID=2748079 RepID=UPI00110DB77D|nr:permease [Rhizobium sp. RM]NWJ25929.1 permease [Rhizobium sp. RM]TMV15792.1 permease [Rhizobium sp. Td3]